MKQRIFFGLVLTLSVIVGMFSFSGNVDAAEVLTEEKTLASGTWTVTTEDGRQMIKKSKQVYELTNESAIICTSSCSITLKLETSQPLQIKKIAVQGNLYIDGKGSSLQVHNDSGVAIDVRKILTVKSNINVEAIGPQFGVKAHKVDVKDNSSVTAIATADDGIGVYGDYLYAICRNSKLYGEGSVSGVYGTKKVKACSEGAIIHGVTLSPEGVHSAVHSESYIKALCKGKIIEEYQVIPFTITANEPVIMAHYQAVANNMVDAKNYIWASNPQGVYYEPSVGGLLGDPSLGSQESIFIEGVRSGKVCNPKERVCLDCKADSQHIVRFNNARSSFTQKVIVRHYERDEEGDYFEIETRELEMAINEPFIISDYYLSDLGEYILDNVEPANDFIVEYSSIPIEVNYYYSPVTR
ncbi:hypothetical protein ACWN8V_05345 [Vagococcus elongatus]|uniref:Uncharacterized protein n=1 Tax=Vagococcus elongatus TaxID=180344 RepID=A0A430AN43_9ENTE|nr:hypothetical protein [Vagococcus elongatus]RSU09580.1 hypothetical protein CBF29_11285 [Vagococcus elongatus]